MINDYSINLVELSFLSLLSQPINHDDDDNVQIIQWKEFQDYLIQNTS